MSAPQPNEKRKDFMKRCMSVVIKEGKDAGQAYAICNNMWERRKK